MYFFSKKAPVLGGLVLNLLRDFGRLTVMVTPVILVAVIGSYKRIHYRRDAQEDKQCDDVVHGQKILSLLVYTFHKKRHSICAHPYTKHRKL